MAPGSGINWSDRCLGKAAYSPSVELFIENIFCNVRGTSTPPQAVNSWISFIVELNPIFN